MKNRIVLIGANGMLGNYLYTYLSKLFEVVPTYCKSNKIEKNFVYLDITNLKSIKSLYERYKPQIIINCAAYTNVDDAENNKFTCRSINSQSIQKILSVISKDTYLIHFSSDYIFDGRKGNYSESCRPNPLSYYGKTKLESENAIIGSLNNYLIFRPGVLFTNNFRDNHFVSWVYKSLKENLEINVTNEQTSNPTYIPLFVEAIYNALLVRYKGLLHYGSDNFISRYDFAVQIANAFSLNQQLINPVNNKFLNQIAKRPVDSSLNTQKIINDLNINTYTTSYILSEMSI